MTPGDQGSVDESGTVGAPPYAGPVSEVLSGGETRTSLVRRARKIDRVLAETYPDARCELDFDDPFQLLVVTVLSAQTTDKRVNAVRPTLFAAYPDAKAMAAADAEMAGRGRLLVRYSGTENLARVMIEGRDEGVIRRQAEDLARIIAEHLG